MMTINTTGSEPEISFWLAQVTQFTGIFIAAFLAYWLGIFQQRKIDNSRKKELEESKTEERFFLIRNAYNEIWAHMAALTVFKSDFIRKLIVDVDKMQNANPVNLGELFSSAPTFLKKFEEYEYGVADALSRIEFVAMKNEHFYEAKFMVRTALKSVNDYSRERHKLIDTIPKGGAPDILVVLNYFIPMLRDHSRGLADRVDLSFTILLCLMRQIEAFARSDFPDQEFKVKKISPLVRKQLPTLAYMKIFADKLGVDLSDLAEAENQVAKE